MMIISPKAADWRIRLDDSYTRVSKSRVSASPVATDSPEVAIRATTASTMMTAPSTIIPKSMAPKLIRFPLTPNTLIMPKANSMAKGMTEATTSPAR